MATLIQVSERQIKKCDRCGTLITFHRNRNGKSYPVEVHHHVSLGMVYRSGIGAYGNLTPWHKCQERQDQESRHQQEVEEELRTRRINEIAGRYLLLMDTAVRSGDTAAFVRLSNEYAAELKAAGLQ